MKASQTSVRLAQAPDSPAIQAIYAPVVLETFISFEIEVPTVAAMAERIETTTKTFPWLVAERDNVVLGYAYAGAHRKRTAYRWSVNTTAYVAEAARGQRIGSKLYRSLISILRLQGFRSAFAGIALPNTASVALHETVGFKPVGVYRDVGYKLGAWRSVGWWRLGLCDGSDEPTEPLQIRNLIGSTALNAVLRGGRGRSITSV